MQALGNYDGKQVAFPFAGYANVLAYRTDLYEAAGLKPPKTMEELVADAMKLTDAVQADLRLRRQRPEGPGGRAGLDAVQCPDGRLDPRRGRQAGAEFRGQRRRASPSTRSCSTRPRLRAPPTMTGAAARRASARASSPTCRPGRSARPATTIRRSRRSSARPASSSRLPAKGLPKKYGVGGWGLAINADIDAKQQEAAWAFIKWITSPAVHKEMNMRGAGSYLAHQRDARCRPAGQVSVPAGARRDLR